MVNYLSDGNRPWEPVDGLCPSAADQATVFSDIRTGLGKKKRSLLTSWVNASNAASYGYWTHTIGMYGYLVASVFDDEPIWFPFSMPAEGYIFSIRLKTGGDTGTLGGTATLYAIDYVALTMDSYDLFGGEPNPFDSGGSFEDPNVYNTVLNIASNPNMCFLIEIVSPSNASTHACYISDVAVTHSLASTGVFYSNSYPYVPSDGGTRSAAVENSYLDSIKEIVGPTWTNITTGGIQRTNATNWNAWELFQYATAYYWRNQTENSINIIFPIPVRSQYRVNAVSVSILGHVSSTGGTINVFKNNQGATSTTYELTAGIENPFATDGVLTEYTYEIPAIAAGTGHWMIQVLAPTNCTSFPAFIFSVKVQYQYGIGEV